MFPDYCHEQGTLLSSTDKASEHTWNSSFRTWVQYLLKKESSQEINVSLQSNPYANVLYDSIWAIALSINGSFSVLSLKKNKRSEIMDVLDNQLSMLSFQGATGLLNFSHKSAAVDLSLELLQFQNGCPIWIGSYHYSSNQLILTNNLL